MGRKPSDKKGQREPRDVTLIVADVVKQADFGRGIVRIDPEVMRQIGLTSGDYIRIYGSRVTHARVMPSVSMDVGTRFIRMDKIIRGNAGVRTGEKVRVRPVEVSEATKIVLAPQDHMIRVAPDFHNWVKKRIFDYVVTKGDVVLIPIFQRFIPLVVVSVSPGNFGKVGPSTVIEVRERPVELSKISIPTITYEDIGGLKEEIQRIREMVELPLKHPELFRHLGIEPPKGVLLYGPPGCGKTLLAKAVANESEANFISVKGPELLSKWVGESEKAVRQVFKKARQVAPAIIFIDEIDSLFPRRGTGLDSGVTERVVSQMLTEIDGIQPLRDIVVIGATNRPDLIDPAILRPGRLERLIYVGPPDLQARHDILKVLTKKMPLADDVDLWKIATLTERFSGADLAALVREAAMSAIREDLKASKVEMRHFESALHRIKPSLTDDLLKYYEEVMKSLRAMTPPEERREESYVI